MIIRVSHDKENPYYCMNKHSANNHALSFKAIGIHAYLMSKPDNWKANEDELANAHYDGKASVRSGIQELINHGYISRTRVIDPESKQITGWEWIVYETPDANPNHEPLFENRKVEPLCGFPKTENRMLISNKVVSNKERERERDAREIPPPLPQKPLVPHKPLLPPSNGTTVKVRNGKPFPVSSQVDGRKFINGFIPPGAGRTPVEVFYERHLVRQVRLTAPLEDDISRVVTDLDRWRVAVTDWQQAGYNPLNIRGQLDWYRGGTPRHTNGSSPPVAETKVTFSIGGIT